MSDHRRYGSVFPTFWSGPTGRALRCNPNAQRLACYLMTCRDATPLGLYYLLLPTAAAEVGLTVAEATAALARLSALGFAHYDPEAEHVWVPELARYQVLQSRSKPTEGLAEADNVCRMLGRLFLALPRTRFLDACFRKYGAAFHLPVHPLMEPPVGPTPGSPSPPSEAPQGDPSEGVARTPPQAPPGDPSGTVDSRQVTVDRDRDTDAPPSSLRSDGPPHGSMNGTEGSDSPGHGPPANPGDSGSGQTTTGQPTRARAKRAPPGLTGDLAAWFGGVFWPLYPWKVSRPNAEKAVSALNPDADLRSTILSAIAWQKRHGCLVPSQDRAGKPVRLYPASWLNGRRWEDEPDPEPTDEPTDAEDLYVETVSADADGAEPAPGGGYVRVWRKGESGWRPP